MPAIGFSAVKVYTDVVVFLSILFGDGNGCSLNIGIHCGKGCARRDNGGIFTRYRCTEGFVAEGHRNFYVIFIGIFGFCFGNPDKLVIDSGCRILTNLEIHGQNLIGGQHKGIHCIPCSHNFAGCISLCSICN